MKTQHLSSLLFFLSFSFLLSAQSNRAAQNFTIRWQSPISMGEQFGEAGLYLKFEGCEYDLVNSKLPFFYQSLPVKGTQEVKSAQLKNTVFVALTAEEKELVSSNEISEKIEIEVINAISKKQHLSFIQFYPFRRNAATAAVEKLISFEIEYQLGSSSLARTAKANTYAQNSVLATGEWFRIGVTEDKMYKLSYHFLKSLGLDIDNIDPRNIRLYGNGAGMLPETNSEPRMDDLLENSIEVVGEEDGKFNSSDYVIFYGEGPTKWTFNNQKKVYEHEKHLFSDTNYYFITADLGPGKRVNRRPNGSALITTNTIGAFLDYDVVEQDLVNLLKSGKEWLGDLYDSKTTYSYSFTFPNALKDSAAWFKFFGVVRSAAASKFQIGVANRNFDVQGGTTDVSKTLVSYGTQAVGDFTFFPTADLTTMNVSYTKPLITSKAWLNYIELNVWRKLTYSGNYMKFRHPSTSAAGQVFEFQIANAAPQMKIWNISEIGNITEQEYSLMGNNAIYKIPGGERYEFMAFDKLDSTVFPKGKVANQNLHAQSNVDMLIVSHPLFLQAAEELAAFHQSEGLRVSVATPQQIYNEFSSGMQDPIAIRSMMKMLYDRANNHKELPSFLLLFGDASYDPKHRISGNTNFVLTYQSDVYLHPIFSYASDDYFGFLDDHEGRWVNGNEKIDIGIGRFPVRTAAEAQAMVKKVKQYSTDQSLGEWRNEIVFVGDDEDGNMHMRQADQLANLVEDSQGVFNISKILLDAYQKVSTPAGARYPEVNKAITEKVQKGALIINYTGHGGETGLAEERILTLSDIRSWTNTTHYPLFITATCEFSRYDDPLRVSAGEEVLLNKNGGSMGLLTTTRPAFAQQNFDMSKYLYQNIFDRNGEEPLSVGEIYRIVKVQHSAIQNARNFTYLGDPAIKLAIPKHRVVTSSINGKPLSAIDTLKALSKVTISGYIADYSTGQKMTDFNGTVYPTVFDKKKKVFTLNNSGVGPFPYDVRDSRLFNGKASVKNGEFSFSFVVPKDIAYEVGEGKITYYATDSRTDANGYTRSLLIGGSNDSALSDNAGPEMQLYLNSPDFIYGGMTSENPTVIIELEDELGINTIGNGIGHDIIMTIDGNSEEAIVLNEYYEAEEDSYRKGKVQYQLKNLSEGKHTLAVKSWDVANNSSEASVEFVVVKEKKLKIDHVLNYPNPFTSHTEFWFEHNQPGIPMDVKIEVFTVSGKLVKSIDQLILSEGYRVNNISWDGRDDFGDKIGKGVYLYKVKVRSRNGTMAEKIEKLVIL